MCMARNYILIRTISQAIPFMQELPEYKAIDDDEGRKAAFAKFVKRQKAG